ncbi:GNAT family N-acetyltransferase [Dysgonomonas mossii]|uniref:GNAT family N-acetyltransferase n=1 Tax=Dysgonomonas mossii TaxID=163665 RepID=UPI00399563C8
MVEIKQIKEVTPDIVSAFSRLMPQLAPHLKAPLMEDLSHIVNDKNKYIFIASNPQIVGTITLVIVKIPSGTRAWIEDVVVDQHARGQSIGEKMLQYVIDFAKKLNVASINLTSSPSRIAANKLYQKLGFNLRETNVYRIDVD